MKGANRSGDNLFANSVVALDIATGDIAWKVPLGITEELPEGKQQVAVSTGVSVVTGIAVT